MASLTSRAANHRRDIHAALRAADVQDSLDKDVLAKLNICLHPAPGEALILRPTPSLTT